MKMAVRSLNTKRSHQNHIVFSDNFRSRSHSFGQVSLPTKAETTSNTTSSSMPAYYASPMAAVRSLQPKLAELWRQLQGCDDWEDLVQPLDPLLRTEIVRYGEFVAATYKAFDLDPTSKRYLNCKYGKANMLSSVGMSSSGYEVTRYIYAAPGIPTIIQGQDQAARWIGYVATASDGEAKRLGRRDITIAFRGTVTSPEWVANMMSSLTPARLGAQNPRPDVKVESGFLSLYTSTESSSKFGPDSCREQLLSEISRLMRKYKGEEMSITLAGHSMGSSLASLLAYDIVELGLNKNNPNGTAVPVTVFSFGGPRVGNLGFKQRCEELGVKVLRVVNVNDPITKMPGVLFNENFRVSFGGKSFEFPWSCSCYAHVGVELVLDFFNVQNPSCVHDLDTYINLLKCSNKARGHDDHLQHHRNMAKYISDHVFGDNFFDKAKDLISTAQQNLNLFPWVNVAENMQNFAQSQR